MQQDILNCETLFMRKLFVNGVYISYKSIFIVENINETSTLECCN